MIKQPDTTAQTSDKRKLRGEKSRRDIVNAAIECIASSGLRNATLENVAQRAGVSRALVVFHFRSKTGLLTAVLKDMHERFTHGWDEELSAEDTTSEKLMKLLEYDVRFASEHPDLLAVWHAFWGEARGGTLYRELSHPHDERYGSDLGELLNKLSEEGGNKDVDAGVVEHGLTAMLFGLWRASHLHHDHFDYEHGIRAIRMYLHKLFPEDFK